MFEQETELILTTIRQRTIANSDTIGVKDILASDIPYNIKMFFRADVEAMLLSELHSHRKSSRFRFDHPEVQGFQQEINSILVLQYAFKRLEYLERLNDAVHMMINYLIRPQWTLGSVVFEREETVSSAALLGMLHYFSAYDYLKDIIRQYIQEKQIASFSRKDFSLFLWKADGEFIRRKSGDELARVMSPIFDFFDYPKNTGVLALPVKALLKYFEDKGVSTVLLQLEGEIAQGRQEINRRSLGELLESVRRTSGAFQVEHLEPAQRDTRSLVEPPPAAAPSPSPENSESHSVAARDFGSIIEDGDRKRFVKKIFDQDDTAFADALRALGSLTTWKQASRFIDEIFIQNNVDPYSSEAERFVDIIFQQYHPKK